RDARPRVQDTIANAPLVRPHACSNRVQRRACAAADPDWREWRHTLRCNLLETQKSGVPCRRRVAPVAGFLAVPQRHTSKMRNTLRASTQLSDATPESILLSVGHAASE